MKKLSIIMIVVTLILSFTACGSSVDNNDKTPIDESNDNLNNGKDITPWML